MQSAIFAYQVAKSKPLTENMHPSEMGPSQEEEDKGSQHTLLITFMAN